MVMARRLAEPMAARGAGHLVFVSSLSGKVASGGGSVYAATKFGLRGFAHGLREDLRDSGVGVSVVLPGFIRDSGMFHDAGREAAALRRHARRPRTSRRPCCGRSSATARRSTSRRWACAAGAAFAGLAPELSARMQRRLGGAKPSPTRWPRGQRDKRA